MNITDLTVHELKEKLAKKEITISEITKAYVDRIVEKETDVKAFVTTLTDTAMEEAKKIEEKVNNGEITSEYAGIPIGIPANSVFISPLLTFSSICFASSIAVSVKVVTNAFTSGSFSFILST